MSYISSPESFSLLLEKSRTLRGFSRGCSDCSYFDSGEFLVAGFWDYLQSLGRRSKDSLLYFFDLTISDPHTYHTNFGIFPLIEFPISKFTERDYIDCLWAKCGPVDGLFSVAAVSQEYLFFPLSLSWHIYGDSDIELAQLLTKVGMPTDITFPHDFVKESEAQRLISNFQSS